MYFLRHTTNYAQIHEWSQLERLITRSESSYFISFVIIIDYILGKQAINRKWLVNIKCIVNNVITLKIASFRITRWEISCTLKKITDQILSDYTKCKIYYYDIK